MPAGLAPHSVEPKPWAMGSRDYRSPTGHPLTSLKLRNIGVSCEALEILKGMPLVCLDLRQCHSVLCDAALQHLQSLPLTSLSLGLGYQWIDRSLVSDAGLDALLKMPLASLCLANFMKLTTAGIAKLRVLPLTRLDLRGCAGLTDPGLEALQGLPLTSLNLGNCRQLTNDGLAHLRHLPLTSLDLRFCLWLTTAGIVKLRGLPLTELSLRGCTGVTGESLWLPPFFPLTSLDLGQCRLTDDSLEALFELQLTQLSLDGCRGLSAARLAWFAGIPPVPQESV